MRLIPISQGMSLYAHIPDAFTPDIPVLVSIHGISRNAKEHCETFGREMGSHAVVLAPEFDAAVFPSYQRLGIGRPEPRADVALEAALAQMNALFGIDIRRPHLFGFSGGAQFCMRYAMLHPDKVASLHLASAGWYTWLDEKAPWPRGCGKVSEAERILDLEPLFQRIPCHVYVGKNDTQRDPALRKGDRIDTQQGHTRLERAHRWVDHIRNRRPRASGTFSLTELPRTGHDFTEASDPAHGGLARLITRAIWSESEHAAA